MGLLSDLFGKKGNKLHKESKNSRHEQPSSSKTATKTANKGSSAPAQGAQWPSKTHYTGHRAPLPSRDGEPSKTHGNPWSPVANDAAERHSKPSGSQKQGQSSLAVPLAQQDTRESSKHSASSSNSESSRLTIPYHSSQSQNSLEPLTRVRAHSPSTDARKSSDRHDSTRLVTDVQAHDADAESLHSDDSSVLSYMVQPVKHTVLPDGSQHLVKVPGPASGLPNLKWSPSPMLIGNITNGYTPSRLRALLDTGAEKSMIVASAIPDGVAWFRTSPTKVAGIGGTNTVNRVVWLEVKIEAFDIISNEKLDVTVGLLADVIENLAALSGSHMILGMPALMPFSAEIHCGTRQAGTAKLVLNVEPKGKSFRDRTPEGQMPGGWVFDETVSDEKKEVALLNDFVPIEDLEREPLRSGLTSKWQVVKGVKSPALAKRKVAIPLAFSTGYHLDDGEAAVVGNWYDPAEQIAVRG